MRPEVTTHAGPLQSKLIRKNHALWATNTQRLDVDVVTTSDVDVSPTFIDVNSTLKSPLKYNVKCGRLSNVACWRKKNKKTKQNKTKKTLSLFTLRAIVTQRNIRATVFAHWV